MNGKQVEGMRTRRTRAEVERLISEYEASGLGRQEFCEQHGLALSTLNRHRNRKQRRRETAKGSRLIPVEIAEASQSIASGSDGSELLVWLSNRRCIQVGGRFDPKVLEQLVRVLEQV